MSHTYRQTISEAMLTQLQHVCEERGVSLQELTLVALFQFLEHRQSATCVPPPTPAEETRGVAGERLSFD